MIDLLQSPWVLVFLGADLLILMGLGTAMLVREDLRPVLKPWFLIATGIMIPIVLLYVIFRFILTPAESTPEGPTVVKGEPWPAMPPGAESEEDIVKLEEELEGSGAIPADDDDYWDKLHNSGG